MKVLVFGGCGFIGSHLVDALLDAGHSVRVLDHSPERFRPPLPGVDIHKAELGDEAAVRKALQGMDMVYHALSTTLPESSNRDPEADVLGNLLPMLRLLNAMKEEGVKRMVYLSSGGTVYGNTDVVPTPESQVLNPVCSYGIVKSAIEKYLFMHQHLHGLQPVVIRPANPYGPRQNPTGIQGAISTFMSRMMRGEPIEIWGDGSIVRDFFHVADLARLCVQAGDSNKTGIYNAGSGKGCSIRELVNIVAETGGFDPRVDFKPARSFDVHKVVLDISKAGRDFGWQPRISLREGILDFWQWMRDNKAEQA